MPDQEVDERHARVPVGAGHCCPYLHDGINIHEQCMFMQDLPRKVGGVPGEAGGGGSSLPRKVGGVPGEAGGGGSSLPRKVGGVAGEAGGGGSFSLQKIPLIRPPDAARVPSRS